MPDRCPTCGRSDLDDPLVAACDVLARRALEILGKRIVRSDRSRVRALGDRDVTEAHLVWPPDLATVRKVLDGAWDQVPAVLDEYGCCGATSGDITTILTRYVLELTTSRRRHDPRELRVRLSAYLGEPVR